MIIIIDSSMFRFLHHNHHLYQKVQPKLIQIAQGKTNADSLINILKGFDKMSFVNRSYKANISNFNLNILAKFGPKLCPLYQKIAQYILTHKPEGIPLLMSSQTMSHTMKKADVLLILCLMSTFLVPPQQYEEDKKLETQFNHLKHFGYIFSFEHYKTIAILQYLKEQLNDIKHTNLTLQRLVTHSNMSDLIKQFGGNTMGQLKISDDSDDIQSHYACLKVDFANKYIGGGALIHGSVQEQIMFAVRPEAYASMLLCQKMKENEALVFIGFTKYFDSKGYGHNVTITGKNKHKYQLDMDQRPQQYITAIDAINFARLNIEQFSQQAINREIIKAYTGFNVQEIQTIASGNWGCGVFGGNLQLKIIIQWIAASLAGKKLLYCPFGKSHQFAPSKCLQKLSSMRISDVYKILIKGCKKRMDKKKWGSKYLLEDILEILQNDNVK